MCDKEGKIYHTTHNVVYKEVFQNLHNEVRNLSLCKFKVYFIYFLNLLPYLFHGQLK